MALQDHLKRSIEKLSEKHKTHGMEKTEKKKHVGFKGAQESVEREGYSKKIAGAIIASRSRHASASAKKANPRLNRVK